MHIRTLAWTVAMAAATSALAQTPFTVRRIGTDNGAFTAIVPRPGDRTRAYALNRTGRILIVENGATLAPTPLLDFSSQVAVGGESGALALAFDPDYERNGYLYVVHSTSAVPRYVLARYTVNPPESLVADPASRLMIMPLIADTQSVANHNGGWIGFGPDGLLYITRGEGPVFGTTAQDPASILGKLLRIDVRTDAFPADPRRNYAIPANNPFATGGGAPEVLALGLRNPWRASIDRLTGDVWIGDVGSTHEEIDRFPAAGGLVNFGYPCYDGNQRTQSNGLCAAPANPQAPTIEFFRNGAAIHPAFISSCVAGGVVYRGCEIPAMYGRYVYGQCGYGGSNPRLASFAISNPAGTAVVHPLDAIAMNSVVFTFGEDAFGEVYIGGSNGLYRMISIDGTGTDCNGNGRIDACEIADGSAVDSNGDGLPDGCTRLCPADVDASGALGVGDVFRYLSLWFSLAPLADFNTDPGITLQDLFDFLAAYFDGCP